MFCFPSLILRRRRNDGTEYIKQKGAHPSVKTQKQGWKVVAENLLPSVRSIRYLGGLLSAYEPSGQKFPVLLQKAKEVADNMAFTWVGSWGSGLDSYFEYLIKAHSSINTSLRTSTVDNFTYFADIDENKRIRHAGSYLAMFRRRQLDLGRKFTQQPTILG
ncbi:glycosyl hydrolase 47 family protein [Pleurotus pulmonarius]